MYKLAFIIGNSLIYWHTVILALAVLTGMVFFLAAYSRSSGDFPGGALACPFTLILALLLARAAHWYFRPDSYAGLSSAMTAFFTHGYSLIGAFAGCILSACILRLIRAVRNLPLLLDCMSIGGAAAIALGRLSFFFTPDDRGGILTKLTMLPFSYPVINTTSGAEEYRFATFLFQAIAAAVIFALLLVLFRRVRRDGDTALLFLLMYCASQIVLDSTRYDSLHLRSNGFVSAAQVLCAVCLVLVIGIFSARIIRRGGMKPWLPLVWVLAAACLTGAGFMEYLVQRRGDLAVLAYSVMSVSLAAIVFFGFLLHASSSRKHTAKKAAQQED